MWNRSVQHKPSNATDLFRPLMGRQFETKDDNELFDDTVDFGTTKRVASGRPPRLTLVETIDNTQLVYIPIRLPAGNQVFCAPDVLKNCPMILRTLQTDISQVLKILPWSVHSLVRRTNIWVNASYAYGSVDDPRVLRHSTVHHEEGWLRHCARDRPEKAEGIEIYSCFDFERMRLHWNGCGLIMHEFCHLIHQFCLPEGLSNPTVQKLYKQGSESGRYEHTLRRDWAGQEEDYDLAYAMVDYKEFFAEMSVSFLCDAYHSLDKANRTVMTDCCPPLLQPHVADRVLRQHGIEDDPFEKNDDKCSPFWSIWKRESSRATKPKLRLVDPIWQEACIARSCKDVAPCNKFYPFTRGQLKHHDPEIYLAMNELWKEVTMYDDPLDDSTCCQSLKNLLPQVG